MGGGKYFGVYGGSKKPLRFTKRANRQYSRKRGKLSQNSNALIKYRGTATPSNPLTGNAPPFKFVKMNYATQISQAITVAGTATAWQWNSNSIYDPDKTGGGHQPYGYDAFALDYTQSITYMTDYVINISAEEPIVVVVRDAGFNTALPTDIELEAERPRGVKRIFYPGGDSLTIKYRVKCWQSPGLTYQQYMSHLAGFSEVMGSAAAITPTILNIMVQAVNGSTTPSVYVNIKATSYSKLFWQKLRAKS